MRAMGGRCAKRFAEKEGWGGRGERWRGDKREEMRGDEKAKRGKER